MRSVQFAAFFVFTAITQFSNAQILTRENAHTLKMSSNILVTFPEDAEYSRSMGRYAINGKEIECTATPPRYSKIMGDPLEFPEPEILLLNHYPNKKAVFSVFMTSKNRHNQQIEIMDTTLSCEYLTQNPKAGNLTVEDMRSYFKKHEDRSSEQVGQLADLLKRISVLNSNGNTESSAHAYKAPKALTSIEDLGTYSASGHSLNRLSDKITGKNLDYSTSDVLQKNILNEAIGSKNRQ